MDINRQLTAIGEERRDGGWDGGRFRGRILRHNVDKRLELSVIVSYYPHRKR